MKYIIDDTMVNSLLNYLAKRPYIEVANLIQGMNGMVVYEEKLTPRNSVPEDALKKLVDQQGPRPPAPTLTGTNPFKKT